MSDSSSSYSNDYDEAARMLDELDKLNPVKLNNTELKSTSPDNEATIGMYNQPIRVTIDELRQILKDVGAGDSQQQEKVIQRILERM